MSKIKIFALGGQNECGKNMYEETQFAVYTVDNALDFLKSYMS